MEEKFILGDITKEQFEKYTEKYQQELKPLSKNMRLTEINGSNFEFAIDKCLNLAENIGQTWVSASFENKLNLQRLIFREGMVYNKKDGVVRTVKTNSLFAAIDPLQRFIEEKEKGNLIKNCLQSSLVPKTGFEPAHPFEYHHLKVACLPISTPGLACKCIIDLLT